MRRLRGSIVACAVLSVGCTGVLGGADPADAVADEGDPAIDVSATTDNAPSVDTQPGSDVASPADVPTGDAGVIDVPAVDVAGEDIVMVDVGAIDVPTIDTGGRDVPGIDVGRPDVPTIDTGVRDVGVDTGPRDVGFPDVGVDAGFRDVGVDTGPRDSGVFPPACTPAAGGGRATVSAPTLTRSFRAMGEGGWLGSPAVVDLDRDGTNEVVVAVVDLDRDGTNEVVVARGARVFVFTPTGTVRWSAAVNGSNRVWAAPVIADFSGDANLEVAAAAGSRVALYNAAGTGVSPFPVTWRDELRSLAAGDLDGDGRAEIVTASTTRLEGSPARDLLMAWRGTGAVVTGFPPNTTRASGCDSACDVTGGFDQNLAIGPIDDDAAMDVFAPMDNAYMSWHRGSGEAFRAASIFRGVTRVPGIRFLHSYAEAQQGYSETESTSNQAHFTNSAPAIADIDGDGTRELVVLASVQNASQSDRQRGVALWVVRADGTRPAAWTTPFHAPTYLSGLSDLGGNIVAATNQVSVVELDTAWPGLEMVFAGFDGRIHCVGGDRTERWTYAYTTASSTLTGGVAVADLSGDGRPEIVFASYSTASNVSALHVLDARGALLHRVVLPGRGSMAVPTVADVDRDGVLDVVVSLKDAASDGAEVLVYGVAGSGPNCLPWPTGRANVLRNGVPTR